MTQPPSLTTENRPASTREVRSMFDAIAPTYDLLNSVLSGGLHRLWERRLVKSLPVVANGRCLDLCTGTGALVPRLAPRYREVVAADISPKMLAVGQRRWAALRNVTWVEADAQALPFDDGSFDVVSIAYGVRNLPRLDLGLCEVSRVLVAGGRVAILEFGQPTNKVWRALFSWYSRIIIPRIGGWLSGDRGAYEYLPTTAAAFPCGEAFESVARASGLTPEATCSLMGGVAYLYVARK